MAQSRKPSKKVNKAETSKQKHNIKTNTKLKTENTIKTFDKSSTYKYIILLTVVAACITQFVFYSNIWNKMGITPLSNETDIITDSQQRNFTVSYQTGLNVSEIVVDGRIIKPEVVTNGTVSLYKFENFLSDKECLGLMKAHIRHANMMSKKDPYICFADIETLRKHLNAVGRSYVHVSEDTFIPGTTCVDAEFSTQLKDWLQGNWSYSTIFYPGESPFTQVYEDRVYRAMGLKPSNGGKFQATSYPQGVGYKLHPDCKIKVKESRDRMGTVLVYLQDVAEGGETTFPSLGITIKPKQGMAVAWNNMDEHGNCLREAMHSANKVDKGRKFIFLRWYYYESFYYLGKRPTEPTLPAHTENQAQVICDHYEEGSCRWYDEWGYSHLTEYVRKESTLQ